MPTLVAIAGDLHTNSTLGLCPPVFQLDDGGQYRASKQQRWIWREWIKFWASVGAARDEHGARLIIILNGETGDDLRHASSQLITRNPADIMKLSGEVLKPALDLLAEGDQVYVTRGTEAHSGVSGYIDEAVACDIGAIGETADGPASWFKLLLDVEGVLFQVSHHPPGGGGMDPEARRRWAGALAKRFIVTATERDQRIPRFVVYGHVHNPADSGDTYGKCRVMVLPSWQLCTSYGHRIGGEPLPIGGAWFVVDNRRVLDVQQRYSYWNYTVHRAYE